MHDADTQFTSMVSMIRTYNLRRHSLDQRNYLLPSSHTNVTYTIFEPFPKGVRRRLDESISLHPITFRQEIRKYEPFFCLRQANNKVYPKCWMQKSLSLKRSMYVSDKSLVRIYQSYCLRLLRTSGTFGMWCLGRD